MNKLLLLMLALAIAITPAIADGGADTAAAAEKFEVNAPDIDAINAKINQFRDSVPNSAKPNDFNQQIENLKAGFANIANDLGTPNSQEEADALNNITAQLDDDVDVFIDKILTELNRINGPDLLGDNTNFPNKGDVEKEAVNDFVQNAAFFLEDHKNPNNPFSQEEDYDRDLESVTERARIYLQGLNQFDPTQNTSTGNTAFDPLEFLDRGAPLVPQRAFSLEIVSTGLDNRFASFSIFTILNQFRARFANDSTLTSNVDFFLSTLPQSAETIAQDGTSETEDVFDRLADLNTIGDDKLAGINEGLTIPLQQNLVNTTVSVNEQGQIVSGALDDSDPRFDSLTDAIPSGTATDAIFNSRQFGGNFHDGTFPTIKLTIEGRTYTLQDKKFTSPLVLDMDGDGNLEASNGMWQPHNYNDSRGKVVVFDLYGIGFDQIVEWVGVNDGLLIVYNGEKRVSGKNLFGDADGFFHGFEKLAAFDDNNDNIISGEELASISVWQDKNQNATVEEGEVKSVTELGITELRVSHEDFVSSFVQNGQEKKMWDWYPCLWETKRQK